MFVHTVGFPHEVFEFHGAFCSKSHRMLGELVHAVGSRMKSFEFFVTFVAFCSKLESQASADLSELPDRMDNCRSAALIQPVEDIMKGILLRMMSGMILLSGIGITDLDTLVNLVVGPLEAAR